MLVLSRKRLQTIMVGNIPVTVVAIKGGVVKLGVEAPLDIRVVKGETLSPPRPEDKGGEYSHDQCAQSAAAQREKLRGQS